MVTQEQLDALDLLIWLGNGQEAGQRLGCNQSTVSRRIQGCLDSFQLRLRRLGGEHRISGRVDLLAMERLIHQLVRVELGRQLRLEATHCISHLLRQPPLDGWILGTFDHHGIDRMHTLLRERIVDAWISSDVFDLPDPQDPDLVAIPISRWPAWLLASATHPLVGETGLSTSDLDRFPVLEFPETIYPRMAQALHHLGFGASHLRLPRYDRGSWNQQTADQVTLSFGSRVSALGVMGQVALPWNVGLKSGETLILRRDLAERGCIESLLQQLRHRFETLRPRCPDLALVP